MRKKMYFLLVCLGLSAQPLASETQIITAPELSGAQVKQTELQGLISQAIQQLEQRSRKDWSYQVSRYENEEGDISSSVEHFDPSKAAEQQWALLSMNGQKPSSKEQQKFVKNKLKKAKKGDQKSYSMKLGELIQIQTLQLIDNTPHKLQASFKVQLSQLGEDASEHLQGRLTFDKTKKFIESIEITNTASFTPLFSAKITDFKLTFGFVKIHNTILPQKHALSMQGTFAFFTEIDEVSKDTFSDYQYLGG